MSVNITLTSSMRSNLSSLKSLASQMSTTQTRLSTGKKVNSAIDNANSYYQSRALTNRASDLDMLLDSMGQSIQTVTTAVHGLEKSAEMLENAAVIAKQAYEAAIIPEKAWFEAQVGPNGAVVTSAQELKNAINANKETICVYGKIDLGKITSGLTLKDNQKLVGVGYFGDFDSEVDKFSAISATTHKGISLITTRNNNLIADVSLNFEWTTNSTFYKGAIYASGSNAVLQNIDVKTKLNWTGASGVSHYTYGVILSIGDVTFKENNNISGISGTSGLWVFNNGDTTFADGSHNTISSIVFQQNATVTIQKGAEVYSNGVGSYPDSINHIILENGAKWWVKNGFNLNYFYRQKHTVTFARGSEIAIGDKYYYLNNDYVYDNHERSGTFTINNNNIKTIADVTEIGAWEEPQNSKNEMAMDSKASVNQSSEQYATMMTAYDEMVADSSYQGVNLLKGGKLTTMFNEDRTHSYTINGKDMSLSGLGITTREWATKDDIAASIKEIQNAMSAIRDEVARLGNNLSIIETRMNFTDGLVDVLQTGADDLVLADMNEESANYLALQTRNNLAVNALALAAQSNNAVLKLF